MAADVKAPYAGDNDAVARRIADLSRKLDEVSAATASAKMAGRVIALLILVVAVFSVFQVVYPFYLLKDRQPEIQQALIDEFNASIKSQLQTEIDESLKKTGPVVEQIIKDKAKTRGPELVEAIDAESKTFMNNVKAMGQTMWTDHVTNLNEQIFKRVAERVPELADQDKAEVAITNAHAAVNSAVERLVAEYLKDHVDSITSIQEELNKFPVPTHIKGMTDQELNDAFFDLLSTYSTNTLKSGLAPSTREFLSDLGSAEKTADADDNAGKGN